MLNDSATADGKAADVYSLAKTLWVLATGQKFPLPGEMKAAIPALTISKYVTDIRAALLDRLVEAATTFDPSTRPTMKEFASELEAWLRPSAGPAINELDLSGYASEIESINEQHYRREKLMSAEIEFKTREGERIRERLRPLANALFAALQRAKFIGPQIGIDNYSYGFYVRGYVASLKEPGEVNLVANGTIWINRDAPASAAPRPGWACVKCSYTVGNDRPRESWSEWCAFLLGGSKEDAELANLISMTEGALLPQVELVLRMSKGEKNA
jgi:hypothetical protein